MNYDWYEIFNLGEFNALGLVSKTYTKVLEGLGEKDILVVKANKVSMIYDDVMLSLEMNGNPFEFEGYAVYIDEDENVYLGIEVDS
jgi:hypothetical protein